MRQPLTKVLLAVFILLGAKVAQAQLYAVVSDEGAGDIGSLLVIDPASGSIVQRIPMTLSGNPVEGVVGIAAHPQTAVLYIILDANPQDTNDRRLATVDPATGVVTDIGAMGDAFCGLTFGSDGTLYAIHANDNADEAAVYTVNLATGATTLFRASADVLAGGFPEGGGSFSIEFNPADGRLYYSRGQTPEFFQMDLASKLATGVPLNDTGSFKGLAFEAASGTFLTFDDDTDEFLRVDPSSGDVTILGMDVVEDNRIRDLAFRAQPGVSSAPTLDGVGIVLLLGALLLIGFYRVSRAV